MKAEGRVFKYGDNVDVGMILSLIFYVLDKWKLTNDAEQ